MSKLNQDTLGEFICEIVEHFEDFLDAKGIKLENPEKQEAIEDGEDPESICNIYGTDYGMLYVLIEGSLNYWELIEKNKNKDIENMAKLICDMSLHGATEEELKWAILFSAKVIDSYKDGNDWAPSVEELKYKAQLQRKYGSTISNKITSIDHYLR